MRRSRSVTLSDIAEQTGVSKVTVSYVLNDRQTRVRISDATRERVLTAAREMGYHPNALARALARKRTDTITLVMQSSNVFRGGSGFMNEMLHGVMEAANVRNLDLMLHTKPQPDAESEARALTDGRTDGSLLLRDRDDPLAVHLTEREHPLVTIFSRSMTAPATWFVDTDNVQGGCLGIEYLLSLGHRRIGYIGGSPHSAAVMDRHTGYLKALKAAGIVSSPAWQIQINYEGEDVTPLVRLMTETPPTERPTAFFIWSDDVAMGVARVLQQECHLRVPEDVSLVGFDGTEVAGTRSSPRLTSVVQPIHAIADKGVELLTARINDEVPDQTQILFAPSLAIRESCAPYSL